MTADNYLELMNQKQYIVLQEEIRSNFPNATPFILMKELYGLNYIEARFCRILALLPEEIVERFEELELDIPTIINLGKEPIEFIQEILEKSEKKDDVSIEKIVHQLIQYRDELEREIKQKEIAEFLSNFNTGSLMHIAAKADQCGVITSRNKGFLIKIAKYHVSGKSKFPITRKQYDFFKDLAKKIHISGISYEICGEKKKTCQLCLDAGDSLRKAFETGVKDDKEK